MLIIEDGTGKEDADSFVDLVEARLYAVNNGYTLPADDAECEVALRKGATYLNLFDGSLTGDKTSFLQSLIYPRTDATLNGSPIGSNYIPMIIKHANVIAAATYADGTDVRGNDDGNSVASKAVSGAVSISYHDNGKTGKAISITEVDDILRPLMAARSAFTMRQNRT